MLSIVGTRNGFRSGSKAGKNQLRTASIRRVAIARYGATIFEVRDFLRHRDVQTTQMWYAYRLQNRQLRTIGMRDLIPN
jgi:hypothetical protein